MLTRSNRILNVETPTCGQRSDHASNVAVQTATTHAEAKGRGIADRHLRTPMRVTSGHQCESPPDTKASR
eukprot:11650090-Heterocapsa_arctica.AAC.1